MADFDTQPVSREMTPFWKTRWEIGMMELYRDWCNPHSISDARALYPGTLSVSREAYWVFVQKIVRTIEYLVRQDNPDKAVQIVPVLSEQSVRLLLPELCDQEDSPAKQIKEVLELLRRMFLCGEDEFVREIDRTYIRRYIREDGLAKVLRTLIGDLPQPELDPSLQADMEDLCDMDDLPQPSIEYKLVPAAIIALSETLDSGWDFQDSDSVGNRNYFILLVYGLHKMAKMTEWYNSVYWDQLPQAYRDSHHRIHRVWGGTDPDGPSYTAYLRLDAIWQMLTFRELWQQMKHLYTFPPPPPPLDFSLPSRPRLVP